MSDIAIGEPAHEIQIEPHWPAGLADDHRGRFIADALIQSGKSVS